jgi:small subunit ribosomal protein S9
MEKINKIGRRKTSVARIYLTAGNGTLLVNDRELNEYFPTEPLQISVRQPLVITNELANYNVSVNVQGGGVTGQAEAIRMAIARALCDINPEHRPSLKKAGFLTRDPRMVERKKFGQRKARKRFQFSKR